MKNRNSISYLMALMFLGALIAIFPPFQTTWHKFFSDSAPLSKKAAYHFKVYGMPCLMSFGAVALYGLQSRLSALGASAKAVFPLSLFASGFMMMAFRSMIGGVAGVPGYALGMALGYTMMSRVHSIQPSGQLWFGRPMVRIVWKGELEAQRRAAARLQAREAPASPEQRNVSSNASNSAKNSSLSLSRAEAGM